ncbi:SDR family NAD(P)-dependent oxidoreductase [Nocardia arthritidis]|uniref:Short chain dehydrogenase n=1 Tax=Nocardia arthritidis TaxID=228602 RepID=A0A6C0R5W3_9NOCA|nr:SDR family NAD(P)-dependent oxidoreductase [Nocardia arthritidis]QHZ99333.1 short chain dehydrogenase [Nocardia arthritidis]
MKHAVVTGATNGIGEAIARGLAGPGRMVTLVGRSDSRLRAARDRIAAEVPGAELALARADFAELDEVRGLAEGLSAGPPPDVVVSNAAVVAPVDRMTSAGLPRMLTINYLAPYLLLRTLSAMVDHARLIIIGSDPVLLAHEPVDLDDIICADPERLGEHTGLWPYYGYARSKNMNTMFAHALARRLDGTGVTVNVCHPGTIAGTGLGTEAPGLGPIIVRAHRDGILPQPGPQPGVGRWEHGRSDPAELPGPEVGARTPIWLAVSPELDGITGRFYAGRTPVEPAPHTTDPERCERLWRETAALVGLAP